jgi:hypothetical protein
MLTSAHLTIQLIDIAVAFILSINISAIFFPFLEGKLDKKPQNRNMYVHMSSIQSLQRRVTVQKQEFNLQSREKREEREAGELKHANTLSKTNKLTNKQANKAERGRAEKDLEGLGGQFQAGHGELAREGLDIGAKSHHGGLDLR